MHLLHHNYGDKYIIRSDEYFIYCKYYNNNFNIIRGYEIDKEIYPEDIKYITISPHYDIFNTYFPNLICINIQTSINNTILNFLEKHLHITTLYITNFIRIQIQILNKILLDVGDELCIDIDIINIINRMNLNELYIRDRYVNKSILQLNTININKIILNNTNIPNDIEAMLNIKYYDMSFLNLPYCVKQLIHIYAQNELN